MLTAILLASVLAAPGDAIYVERPGEIVEGKLIPATPVILDYAQRQELASAVAAGFPGIPPASLDEYYCFANPPQAPDRKSVDLAALAASLPWRCDAADGNPMTTDEAALDYELDSGGLCKLKDRADGTSFLFCTRAQMSPDGRILNNAFTESIFSQALNMVYEFRCRRNPAIEGEIACAHAPMKIAQASVWRADQKAGKVIKTIGKVAPAS